MIKTRKYYRATAGSRFTYDYGAQFKDPTQRNTISRQVVEEYPLDIDKEIVSTIMMRRTNENVAFTASCENMHVKPGRTKLHLIDLYRALQDRNLIPCHSVHSVCLERIAHMLN